MESPNILSMNDILSRVYTQRSLISLPTSTSVKSQIKFVKNSRIKMTMSDLHLKGIYNKEAVTAFDYKSYTKVHHKMWMI